MLKQKILLGSVIVSTAFLLVSCGLIDREITLVDAKTASGIDANLMPVKPTDIFPKGTSKVYCWLKWKDARINTQITARWHYITDDIPVFTYSFTIPKKEGAGSVVLSMPEGKTLPAGSYKAELLLDKHVLKSIPFKVE